MWARHQTPTKPKRRTATSAGRTRTATSAKLEPHRTPSLMSLSWGRWWRKSLPSFTVSSASNPSPCCPLPPIIREAPFDLWVCVSNCWLPGSVCRRGRGEEHPGPRALWTHPEGPWLRGGPWAARWGCFEEALRLRHQDTDEDLGAKSPHSVLSEEVSWLLYIWALFRKKMEKLTTLEQEVLLCLSLNASQRW